MRRSLLAIPVVLPAVLALAWLGVRDTPDEDIADRLDRSVVRIYVSGPLGVSSGTGIVLNRDGFVATNFHVVQAHVEMSWTIDVADRTVDAQPRRPAEVVHVFPGEDLAILRVDGLERPPITFARPGQDGLSKGLEVVAIGFTAAADRLGPVDEASYVPGAVSRSFPGAWADGAPTLRIIQHTAPTNPGFSGGPLVDGCGFVVGMNTQREAQMVYGPGGIPLVTDPIQGVFYASDATVLTAKLAEAGIDFQSAETACGGGLLAAMRKGPGDVLAMGAIVLSIAGLGLLWRPRPAVQVVVECGNAVSACAEAIERAVRNIRSGRGEEPDVTLAPRPPPETERKCDS